MARLVCSTSDVVSCVAVTGRPLLIEAMGSRRSPVNTQCFLRAVTFAAITSMPLLAAAQTPWPQGDNPAATQDETTFDHYQFRDGQTLDRGRIHYATLGSPHRGTHGQIDNAV